MLLNECMSSFLLKFTDTVYLFCSYMVEFCTLLNEYMSFGSYFKFLLSQLPGFTVLFEFCALLKKYI